MVETTPHCQYCESHQNVYLFYDGVGVPIIACDECIKLLSIREHTVLFDLSAIKKGAELINHHW